MTDTTEIVKTGRPTDYLPEYCSQVIEHCSKGYSFESFAGKIRVTRSTLYNWREAHPDFLDAAGIAKECCREFWETIGINGTKGDINKYNSGSWQFIMKNFFRDEWSDTVKQEITGQMPVKIVGVEGFTGFGKPIDENNEA